MTASTQIDWFCFVFPVWKHLFFSLFHSLLVRFGFHENQFDATQHIYGFQLYLFCVVLCFAIKISSCAPHSLWPFFFSCLSRFASTWTFATRLTTRPNRTEQMEEMKMKKILHKQQNKHNSFRYFFSLFVSVLIFLILPLIDANAIMYKLCSSNESIKIFLETDAKMEIRTNRLSLFVSYECTCAHTGDGK